MQVEGKGETCRCRKEVILSGSRTAA